MSVQITKTMPIQIDKLLICLSLVLLLVECIAMTINTSIGLFISYICVCLISLINIMPLYK